MINMACRHKKGKAKKIIKSLTLYVCEAHYSLYQSVEGVASRPTKSGGGSHTPTKDPDLCSELSNCSLHRSK